MTPQAKLTRLMTHNTSRRSILAAIPGALILAAGVSCGSDDEDDPTATTPAGSQTESDPTATQADPTNDPTATEESATPESASESRPRLVPLPPAELGAPDVPEPLPPSNPEARGVAKAAAEYDDFGTDAAPGEFPRVIRHAMGENTLEAKPERVVVLDSGELDSVIRLGIKPVGALDYDASLTPDYLLEGLEGVTTVGALSEPDIEAIAALKPDLILSSMIRHEEIYETLNTIAPTVFGVSTGVVWKQNFALHSQALGLEEEAHATVLEYEERVRDMNARLPEPRPSISMVRMLQDNVRYYQLANYSGTILRDLGFPRPDSQNVDDFALLNQSLETLGEFADADFIFVSPTTGPENEMLDSPVWNSVPAVQDGRFRVVLDDVWMAGIGYRAAQQIMDDIAEELID